MYNQINAFEHVVHVIADMHFDHFPVSVQTNKLYVKFVV